MPPPEPTPASVAVAVASRDRPAALARALRALAAVVPADVEVLVVDSASTSAATADAARAAGVRCVRADRPGLAVARNVALRHLDADVVAFTDDDCLPRPGWLEALAGPFSDPAVAFATGTVRGLEAGTAADVVGVGRRRWTWPDDPLQMGSGANMAVRRQAVLAVGGFDERLGAGAPVPSAEEHDTFLRCLWQGHAGVHVPDAEVAHDDRRSRWATLRLFRAYGLGSGALCALARDLDPHVARGMRRRRLWAEGVRGLAAAVAGRHAGAALGRAWLVAGVLQGLRIGARMAPRPLDAPRPTTVVVNLADQRRERTDSHGIINFSLGLAAALPDALRPHERLVVLANPDIAAELDRESLRAGDELRMLPAPRSTPARLWTDHVRVPRTTRRLRADVVLQPKGFLPLRRRPRWPRQVVCVHDDIPRHQLRDPRLPLQRRIRAAYFTALLRHSLRTADRRLFVSATTRDAVAGLGGGPRTGDTVVLEGLSLPRVPRRSVVERIPCALLLGSPLPHKNTALGLHLARTDPELAAALDHVVVVGWCPPGAGAGDGLPVEHLPGPLTGAELATLIATSRVLVYPSELEGFGLPPLEAYALGTPALHADLPTARELLGGAPGAFDPADPATFGGAVRAVLALDDADLARWSDWMWSRYSWSAVVPGVADAIRAEARN